MEDTNKFHHKRKSECILCKERFSSKKFGKVIWKPGFHVTHLGLICFSCYISIDWMQIVVDNIKNLNVIYMK